MTADKGMRQFVFIWLGQIVSMLGSAMTWFAFTIWAWERTGEPSALAYISFFTYLPMILFTPVAGALVDRWNGKLVMMFSDMSTALGTLAALLLYLGDSLEIWHVCVIGVFTGFFTAFQYPAYAAAVTVMLPREQYARAQGMLGLLPAVSSVFGPMLGAVFLYRYDAAFIMSVDLITFLAAFGTLLSAKIPQPAVSEIGAQSRSSLWRETLFGFRYIYNRGSFLSLVKLYMPAYFFIAIGATLMSPLVLNKSQDGASALAVVQSVGALGGIAGGTVLGVWGGPKRRIHGVLIGGAGACLLGVAWLGASFTLFFWAIGSFFFSFFEPFIEGVDLSLWQSKVERDVQGRVLSARYMLMRIPFLLGVFASGLLTGLVADLGFFNQVDVGAFMSLILVFSGVAGAATFLSGYARRNIREIDSLILDRVTDRT